VRGTAPVFTLLWAHTAGGSDPLSLVFAGSVPGGSTITTRRIQQQPP